MAEPRVHRRYERALPDDDDHPYRTGAWRPNLVEYDADDLTVIEGHIPEDLEGVYLRNTENPLLPAIGRYHPFDGDGMVHAIHFGGGHARYRNRMVQTRGLAIELEAGAPQWAGIIEPPSKSARDGWGARTRLKDSSSTDVIVHNGRALTTFYQCGDAYQLDLATLDTIGTAPWSPPRWGVSAHPKVDEHTGELFWFSYSTEAPYLRFGLVDRHGAAVHTCDVPLPGPRLPHDMAFTERFVILNDLPLFWDPEQLAKGVYRPRFHADLPSRFAVVPRKGGAARWFEAAPTYVLHWINAYERGDEIILDGFAQANPTPRPDPADGVHGPLKAMVDLAAMGARPHRWRFDLRTGACAEEPIADLVCEFPTIDGRRGGRAYRRTIVMTAKPGWFLFDGMAALDVDSGAMDRFRWPDGVYGSEAPIAPRSAGAAEADGYVVTFVADTVRDTSECQIFDALALDAGPIARIALPERICHGVHACWAPA